MSRPNPEIIYLLGAFLYATRSTCSQRKTGCIITDNNMLRPVGIGYNGNYQGGPNECDFPDAVGEARCGCVHAEMNAMAKAPYGLGQIAFVTVLPCSLCAKQLYNAGVRKVVTIESNDEEYDEEKDYRRSSIKLLEEMGVVVVYIDIKELDRLIAITADLLSSLKNNENDDWW